MNKYKILKKVGLWLFITAFVVNVTMTSYAASHVRVYNSVDAGLAAALSGTGPLAALLGLALLAAGLAPDTSNDLTASEQLQEILLDAIENGSSIDELEVLFSNLEVNEDGNIDYKQVVTNIEEYVSVNNIVISTAQAVSFDKDVLYVAPEVVEAMAVHTRAAYLDAKLSSGEVVSYQGSASYPTSFDLDSGFVFPVGSEGDLKIREIISSGKPYVVVNSASSGDVNIIIYSLYTFSYNNFLYASCNDTYNYCSLDGNLSSSSPYGGCYTYDFEGNLISSDSAKYIYRKYLPYIYYFGGGFYFSQGLIDLLGLPDTFPETNDYPLETSVSASLPLRDIYDGVYDDVSTAPVLDIPSDNYITLDNAMVTDLDAAYENVIAVVDGVADDTTDKEQVINDALTKELTGALESANERTEATDVPSESTAVGWEDLKTDGLIDKFPFCIPFDLISLVNIFDAEPEAPYIDIPVVVPVIGVSDHIVIDFSKYEYVAEIMRNLEVVGFVLFLVLKTRELIKG